jgi:replicative DNA helicase
MQPFVFSEDTASLTTVSALASKVQEYAPDVLFVDGVYLMDDEEGEPKGSPQALTNITRALKRMAQRFDIPVVATTQVLSWKLQNRKTRAVTADAIGYTSSFAQDADLILGVERNPDIDDQAIIRVVLARTAPTGEVHVKWDWTTMEFEEVMGDAEATDPSFD